MLANADRVLPVADESVDAVVSLFGRRPAAEIARILSPGGIFCVAVPASEDLIELREQVQRSGHRRSRWESVVETIAPNGLELVEHQSWRTQVSLDQAAIADALAMTYRAFRFSEQARLGALTAAEVTLAADLILFRRQTN